MLQIDSGAVQMEQPVPDRHLVSRNLMWQTSSMLIAMIATFVYGLLVARYLGPGDFGRFSFVVAVMGWVVALALGGGTNALTILGAQDPMHAGNLFWPGIAIQLTVGVLAVLVGLPILWIMSRDAGLLAPAVLYGVANLNYLVTAVIVAIFRGLDRMEWGLATAASSAGMALLVIPVIALNLGLDATIAVNAISQLVVLAIVFPLAWRRLPNKGWHREAVSRLWSASVALWGVMLLLSLHWRVGVLVVQALSGPYELGIYSAAAKLVENMRIIPGTLMLAFVPAMVRLGRSDQNGLSSLVQQAYRYVILVAFPVSIGLLALSPLLIELLYTPDYAASARVLSISAVGLVPMFAGWVSLYVLMSLRLERQLMAIYGISILVEAGMDLVLVPRFGAQGAAVGFVAGEIAAALLGGWAVVRVTGAWSWSRLLRIGLVGVVCLVLVVPSPAGMRSLVWAAGACALYLVGVFGLRAVTPSELRMLTPWTRRL